jgi:hypothetical protein
MDALTRKRKAELAKQNSRGQWGLAIGGGGLALALSTVDPRLGFPLLLVSGGGVAALSYATHYFRAQRGQTTKRKAATPAPVSVPPSAPPVDTAEEQGKQQVLVPDPQQYEESEPVEEDPEPEPEQPSLPHVSYHPDLADGWWKTYFPSVNPIDLDGFEVVGAEGQTVARPLTWMIERFVEKFGAELQRVMVGTERTSAEQPGSTAIVISVTKKEPSALTLRALRAMFAGVEIKPYQAGGYSLIIAMARPCGDIAGENEAVIRQRKAVEQLPATVPYGTRYPDFRDAKMTIPLGVVFNPKTGECEVRLFHLEQSYHIGVMGKTRSGKDQMVSGWLFTLALNNKPADLLMTAIDPKGEMYQWLNTSTHAWRPTACHNDDIARLVEEMLSMMRFRALLFGNAMPGGGGELHKFNALPQERRIAAWRQTLQTWPDGEPYRPQNDGIQQTGRLPRLVVVITEGNSDILKSMQIQLDELVKQVAAVGFNLIFVPQQAQGVSRFVSQLSAVLSSKLGDPRDSALAFKRPNRDGTYHPHILPEPNGGDVSTKGLFVIRQNGEETILRALYLNEQERESLVVHLSRQRPRKPAPAPEPKPEESPGALKTDPDDAQILEWYRERVSDGQTCSMNAACYHFYGSKGAKTFPKIQAAYERLGLSRPEKKGVSA